MSRLRQPEASPRAAGLCADYIVGIRLGEWRSESVKPYHKEIIEARSKDTKCSNQLSRTEKKCISAINRSKKVLKKLETQTSAAKATIASTERDDSGDEVSSDEDVDNHQAGNAFGGKESVVKKKKKKGKKS